MRKKERDSGMELLRILAILMVICVHMFSYGGFYEAAKAIGGHVHSTALLMKVVTRPAVNIFVLITGYFMINQPFALKKSMRRSFSVYQKMLFYSVVLTVIFLILGPEYLIEKGKMMEPWQAIFKGLCPMTSQTWYFLTNYLLLCLLIPFLNMGLQILTKKEYRVLLLILVLFLSVWASLLPVRPFRLVFENFGYENALRGKNVFHFILIYVIGGYIGMYVEPKKKPDVRFLIGAAATVLVNYLLYTRLPAWFSYGSIVMKYSNPLVIANAVFLLMFFKDLHFRSRPVNLLASTTLGVYAISEFRFLRTFLWRWLHFDKADCGNIFKNVLMIALYALIVFFGCAVIDLLREQLFRIAGKLWKRYRSTRVPAKKAS